MYTLYMREWRAKGVADAPLPNANGCHGSGDVNADYSEEIAVGR